MQRKHKYLLVGCVLLLVAFSCIFTSLGWKNSKASSRNTSQVQLVGTWKNQHGNIFDFRKDGTLRSRWTGDKTNAISYFKYRLVGDELCIDYAAKPDEHFRRARQAVFGMNTERSRVTTLSHDKLGLLDSRSGETVLFERSHDAILNDAP
jgi:hypothetical protein